MTRRILISLILLIALHAGAQEPRFGEKIDVKLIEIDIVVTDRDGNRVHGLAAGDFEVLEGRKLQEITNFTEYRAAAVVDPAAAKQTVSKAAPHTLLLLVDELPRSGFVRSKFFERLEALMTKAAFNRDRIGVVYWEPILRRPRTILEPTTDVFAVARAIRKVAGILTAGEPAAPDQKTTDAFFDNAKSAGSMVDAKGQKESTLFFGGESDLFLFRRKTSAMKRLVTLLSAAPGKKSMLYVSQSFALPEGSGSRLSATALVEDLVKTANAGGVTFYAMRPVVPEDDTKLALISELDGLTRLTGPTGGLLDFGANAVETLGAKMAEDFDSYYSIAYRGSSDGSDRERRIVVKPRNEDYRVRARQSFVEKSNETLAREALLTRIFAGSGGDDLRFEVEEGRPRNAGRGRWYLPIKLRIPSQQLQFVKGIAQVKIMIVAANGVAEMTGINEDNLRVVAGKHDPGGIVKYSVEILADRRGSEVSIGVFDRRSGLVGVKAIDIRGRF